jgi:hypothetical protein
MSDEVDEMSAASRGSHAGSLFRADCVMGNNREMP